MKKKMTAGHVIIVAVLVLLAILSIYPLWYTLIVSFSDKAYVNSGQVWFWPKGFNLTSYQKLMKDTRFFGSFLVSVERTVIGLSMNLVMMIITSYPLCLPDGRFRLAKYYKWFFLANMLFAGGLVPSYVLMGQYHLFDSIWALILPGAVNLWNVIYLMNFFRNVPYELNEAATVDGATPMQIMMKIYVPLSKASLACLLLFQFVGHWNSWFDGLLYINDTAKQPLQTYIYQITSYINMKLLSPEQIKEALKLSNRTLSSAKVITAMVPILAIYPLMQKYFISGMTLGGVKG